jgi:hypothetical protein
MKVLIKKGLFVIILITFGISVFAQQREYLIKSAFIERITRFIEWPDEPGDGRGNIRMGVITNNKQIHSTIKSFFSDQSIQNMNVNVEKISKIHRLSGYDLIFITDGHSGNIKKILSGLKEDSVLIITESEGYGEKGAHINFIMDDNKLRYEINETQIDNSGFYVSSKLYVYATIITSKS